MKTLVVSHSCVVDVNQQVYVALDALANSDVALLIPANWRSEYTGEAMPAKLLPSVTFPVFQAPVLKPGNVSLHAYKHLPLKELKTWKPDVILSTQEPWSLSNAQVMWLAKQLGIPFIFQTNQNIVKRYPPPFSWLEAMAFKRAALALAYSEEARQVMTQKGLTVPSAVVPYATDTSMFVRQNTDELRTRLGIAGSVVVGYLGRLVPEKGIDTLILALAQVKNTLPANSPSVKVLLVGAGVAENELRTQAQTLGVADEVVFTGVVPHSEAPKYMSCVDIFVLPSRTTASWKEQFGRVIIEALACGAPVIGSDSGQIPILIQETGGGRVFNEGNADALAAVLTELALNDMKRARLARMGQETVNARYTCEAVARQLYGLLSSVCQNAGTTAPITSTASASEVAR